jgi:MoaA/NifB/PqqE/SkfB family radical SAM enzyme
METVADIAIALILNGQVELHNGYTKYYYADWRGVFSPNYNYIFNIASGFFARWGRTIDDDPDWCPFGNEILDLEVSVNGCSGRCPFCYKSNLPTDGYHMSLETFEQVLAKMPPTLGQIALGLTDIDSHPELVEILQHTRDCGIVPNFTTNGLNFDKVDLPKIVSLVGAIAVSCYAHLGVEVCYKAIRKLRELGLEQTNMHLLYHAGNMPFVYSVLHDIEMGYVNPNAVVLLGLKPKGRADDMQPLPPEEFTKLMNYCFEHKIPVGMDSCSASKVLKAIDDLGIEGERKAYLHTVVEPCESGLFSAYISADAKYYPCSFCEEAVEPIDVLAVDDFVRDVWYSESVKEWRKKLLDNKRACPVYEID